MTYDSWKAREPDPCTEDARAQGCTCRVAYIWSNAIDPPEPVRDRNCPLHGCEPDPDEARERASEDREFWATQGHEDDDR